ncbi:hypothetical protein BGZ49_002801 [Haplosporangium sp. Z 27]|nr:hypothetical protein BGZ49_002801 [Haplosporangium sp. Z 27]
MLIWGLSIMVHSGAWRYVMWYITIAIEVSVLVSFGRRTSVTFAGSHLSERFALFTIIVFGENIIGLLALSSGAVFWDGLHGVFICLFLLLTIILYGLWWIYFDDFSEDIFRETTTLSQLWAYLHLPLHLCIVLVGSGALDLIRLYKQENHIEDYPSSSSSIAEHFIIPEYQSLRFFPKGFEVPFEQRPAMVAAAGAFPDRHIDYRLTKRYFLVACSLVFLFNSLIKWINLRSYDRFQKVVYLSRLLNAILILCLLAVPLDKMTPFALLGSMALFCALQVAVDLAVIYFGAYGFVEDVEAWAKSPSSSSDLGNFPRSPLSIGPHPRSVTSSRRGSVVDSHVPSKGSATNIQYNARSYNAQQNQSCQNHYQQKQLLSQSQTSPLSQHQQQALFNMNVNANSLGSSGAYGNLVQTLAEIKKREQWDQHSKDGLLPSRQISLRGVEQESSANKPSSQKTVKFHKHSGIGQNRPYLSKNTDASLASSVAHVSTSFTLSGDEQSSLRSSDGPGSGAIGLAALFNQQPTTP